MCVLDSFDFFEVYHAIMHNNVIYITLLYIIV